MTATLFDPPPWRPRPGMAEMLPDDAVSPWPHPQRAAHARVVAWTVEQALGDRVAWCSILGDVTVPYVDDKGKRRWRLAPTLAAFRAVHGNRKGKRRRGAHR